TISVSVNLVMVSVCFCSLSPTFMAVGGLSPPTSSGPGTLTSLLSGPFMVIVNLPPLLYSLMAPVGPSSALVTSHLPTILSLFDAATAFGGVEVGVYPFGILGVPDGALVVVPQPTRPATRQPRKARRSTFIRHSLLWGP